MSEPIGIRGATGALAALLFAGAAAAAPVRFAQVNSVRGQVERLTRRTKDWKPVKVGDKLFTSDRLRTGKGSRTVLRLDGSDSTLIFVGPNTLIEVHLLDQMKDGARRSRFFVQRGKVRSRVRKLKNPNSRVEFQTPACMGGVRGTELAATGSREGLTAFGVAQGAVAVTAQGAEVELPEGTMNLTKPGEPPSPPKPLPTSLEIVLEQPATDLSTNQPQFTLRGHTAPGALVTLNAEDIPVNEDGVFSATVTLKEGVNVFTFDGTDVANNKAHVVRRITLDTTPPPLHLD